MRIVTTVLSYALFALAVPFLLGRAKLRRGFKERLGLHPRGWPGLPPDAPRVIFHGASAGDILALLPTVKALRQLRPEARLIATTITNSGHAIIQKHADAFDAATYLPYDLPVAVRRCLGAIKPDLLVLEYTELWPNLIHCAKTQGVSIVLHNGRLNGARLRRYRWLFRLAGNLLNAMSLLLMRDEGEADRALALGADAARVCVAGNTKFDRLGQPPSAESIATLRAISGYTMGTLVWVAGSTHEGEEELLLETFAQLRRDFPTLKLILAPRYTERSDRLLSMAVKRGFSARLRSKSGPSPEVLVLDTIGELTTCYAIATLVFVGGSFIKRGGQNILEPAACGKPVLFGPNMHNFTDAVQVLLGRGGIQVASSQQLERVIRDLLSRPDHLRELGAMARAQLGANRGAALRNAKSIAALLPRGKPGPGSHGKPTR